MSANLPPCMHELKGASCINKLEFNSQREKQKKEGDDSNPLFSSVLLYFFFLHIYKNRRHCWEHRSKNYYTLNNID
jgi:hypothetical protein